MKYNIIKKQKTFDVGDYFLFDGVRLAIEVYDYDICSRGYSTLTLDGEQVGRPQKTLEELTGEMMIFEEV